MTTVTRLSRLILLVLTTIIVTTSCKKSKETPSPAPGDGIVSIVEVASMGNTNSLTLDWEGGMQTVTLISLKSTNSAAVKVKIAQDPLQATAAKLMPLPTTSYTLKSMEYDVPANGTSAVNIDLNKASLRADTVYGLYLSISEVSAGGISATAKNMLVKIKVRNASDGRYKVTGTLVDYTNATYAFTDQEVDVISTIPGQVKVVPVRLGIVGLIIKIGGSDSYYSEVGPVLTFDNAGKIALTNFYGQPSPTSGRSVELDPSGTNQFNSSNKSFALKFWVNQPSAIAGHRALFNTMWTYLSER